MIAGSLIGVFAALMGVAGGELLIPTIVLFYGTDIKIAGSLSLLVSLPTGFVNVLWPRGDGLIWPIQDGVF